MRTVARNDLKSTARTNPSTKPGDATEAALEGRLNRARRRSLGLSEIGPKDPPDKKKKKKRKTAAGGERSKSEGELKLAKRELRPISGIPTDYVVKKDADGIFRKIPGGVYRGGIPTVRTGGDNSETAHSTASLEESDLVMQKARSIVLISSVDPDGAELFRCSGTVYEFDEASKTAKILTSSLICENGGDLWHSKQKVFVHLSNKTKVEARFLLFNNHYQVALLQIAAEHPLVPASFGSKPNYGQKVFILGRNEDYYLIVRRGTIPRLERPFEWRIHYLFCTADSPTACIGGSVINKTGEVIGIISADMNESAIMSISTVIKCIKMWDELGYIVHPVHELHLKAVRMLNVYRRDELSVQYNITSGFVVDKVMYRSNAEKMGIRRGDVIDVMSPKLGTTVPEFEDDLLEIGRKLLEEGDDLSLDLEIVVHNLYDGEIVRTVLPMRFNAATHTSAQRDSLEFEVKK